MRAGKIQVFPGANDVPELNFGELGSVKLRSPDQPGMIVSMGPKGDAHEVQRWVLANVPWLRARFAERKRAAR